MHICKYCKRKYITGQKLGGHVVRCKRNPKYKENCRKTLLSLRKNSIIRGIKKYGPFIEKVKECFYCKNEFKIKEQKLFKRKKYFCSKKCSYTRKFSKKTRMKMAKAMLNNENKGRKIKRICPTCKNKFKVKNNKFFCSHICYSISPKNRAQKSGFFKKIAKLRYKQDDPSIGWQSRKDKKPSYPENFFIRVLNRRKIPYEREYKISKFFADFAFLKEKVVLEIDGKQHKERDRKKADKKRDKILRKLGWNIFRIPWKNINNEGGKKYIKTMVQKFIIFLNSNKEIILRR